MVVALGGRPGRAGLWAASALVRRRPVPLLVIEASRGDLDRIRAGRLTRLVTARMVTASSALGGDQRVPLDRTLLTAAGIVGQPSSTDDVIHLGIDDLAEVVEVHMNAFPSSATTQLGRTVVDRYYRWQFIGPHPLPHASGVRVDGELVGFLFGGVRRDAVSGFARRFLAVITLNVVTHPWALKSLVGPKLTQVGRLMLRRRPAPSASLAERAPAAAAASMPQSFGILAIAVTPRAQGTPAADQLMAHAEKAARDASIEQMHLTVDPRNPRAIRFYERNGWTRLRSPDGSWTGRMKKDLRT